MKLLLFLFLLGQLASIAMAQTFSIAKFSIGEGRIQLDQNEFSISYSSSLVKAFFIPKSVQWIRNENNLLIPQTLMAINVKSTDPTISIVYLDKSIIPVKKTDYYSTEIYVDLFNPQEVFIYQGHELLDTIKIEAQKAKIAKEKQLIDYSCVPFQLEIEGIDQDYLSVGCKLGRKGPLFHQTPRLEVTISSPNITLLNGRRPPFNFYLTDNSPLYFQVLDAKKNSRQVTIKAKLPSRISRLKFAMGLGPYSYQASEENKKASNQLAPSLMLYGKFDLTETSSMKAFDAALYSKSFFNNSGLYFSYDLADLFDGRVIINALLGFQGINYRFDSKSTMSTTLLYPQGVELTYRHAFGLLNKHLFAGMFFSTNAESYVNSWLRFGGKTFLELNYIHWGQGPKAVSMTGLSIGFPFFEAF